MDLLLKKLDEGNKQQLFTPVHAMSSHSTCEVCGNGGHSGNDCPETREDAAYIIINNNNNRYRPQVGQGWSHARPPFQGGGNNYNSNFNSNFNSNQPSSRDFVFGQAKINETLNKKLAANDKIMENRNTKVETLSSALKNQLSFNKMIETQFAQVAAAVPFSEKLNAVTTRGGKSIVIHHILTMQGQQQTHKKRMKNPQHLRTPREKLLKSLSIQASFCFPLGNERSPWMSSSLISLR
jgi:hypothetical protein